jgi:RimJ/RimL family protein N-acetyltransferase
MRKVTAGTMATNTGMLCIMKKAGMVEDGVRKRHFLADDREVDLIYAALYRENRTP